MAFVVVVVVVVAAALFSHKQPAIKQKIVVCCPRTEPASSRGTVGI